MGKTCTHHPDYKGVYPPKVDCRPCRMVYTANQLSRLSIKDIADKLGLVESTILGYIKTMQLSLDIPPEAQAHHEAEVSKKDNALREEKAKSRARDARIAELEEELEAALAISATPQTYEIKPNGSVANEATAVVLCSDWHLEEVVRPSQVSQLNEFNERVCKERVLRFWRHVVKLVKKEQKAALIENMILALLGDFITGSLHHYEETNRLSPIDAAIEALEHLTSGIEYILAETDLNLIIPCHVGNHGRITQRIHHHNEEGNNLEKFIYHSLRRHFEGNERVEFLIADGYHSYIDVFGWTLRFHHGHSIRYSGGVGGVTIALNKAIAQWNKGRRADYDFLGHYHSFFDNGNAVMNGSLIGYSPFALKIKASYTPPEQAFCLIDRDDGKTIVCPVVLQRDK